MTNVACISPPASGRSVEESIELTRRAAMGDATAARALICRVSGRVKNTCRYLTGKDDVDDFAQMTLIQMIASAGSFRGESSFEFWVDRITVRTVSKQLAKSSRRRHLREMVLSPCLVIGDVEQDVALKELRGRLIDQFMLLTEKQRGAVTLHYLYGYEAPEIADLLGVRLNAVRSRLRKGIRQLRRNILKDPCLREWVREGRI